MFAASLYVDAFRVCGEEIVTLQTRFVWVPSCRPLAIADMAPVMLLVVVLIWDDVVEIGLFGSTLRKKTEELQRGQEHLAQQPTLLVPALDVRKANEALEEKSKQWLETPTAGPPR